MNPLVFIHYCQKYFLSLLLLIAVVDRNIKKVLVAKVKLHKL